MKYYSPGDLVTFTYNRIKPRRDELILPLTIVEDLPDHTIAFITAGTPISATRLVDGKPIPRDIPYREIADLPRSLQKVTWVKTNVLFIWKPEWHWDVRLYWDEDSGEFTGWYMNIQDPVRRVEGGYASTDHFLDIVIAPNRQWHFKDRAELEDAVEIGMYSLAESESIHTWADEALELVRNCSWPFNTEFPSHHGQ